MNEKIVGVLGLIVTVTFFTAIGSLPNKFVGYMLGIVVMYFYVTTKKLDNMWLKVFVLFAIVLNLVYWHNRQKEGFHVSPLKQMSTSITAKQCQDLCESSYDCKYAQVPLGTSKSGNLNYCWNSYGLKQFTWGAQNTGGDTWQNMLYKDPVTHSGRWSGRIATSGRRSQVVEIKTDWLSPSLKIKQINLTARLRDQGWGNPTWGIYIVGRDVNGKTVFREVVKAPRSKRTVSYTQCYGWWWWRYCYRRYYTVMGPRKMSSVSDNETSNTPVRSLRIYAYSRGAGHSLDVDYVKWSVVGYPS